LTVVGNLTADPELRFTAAGVAVCSFSVAATDRVLNKVTEAWEDGPVTFLRCSAWRDLAEHVSASLSKGHRVVVTGRLVQRSYETREGEKRTVHEVQVDEVAPSLRFVSVTVLAARPPLAVAK
jgi:single-strand DNA-binding protein